jgi:hypothetical protein
MEHAYGGWIFTVVVKEPRCRDAGPFLGHFLLTLLCGAGPAQHQALCYNGWNLKSSLIVSVN